MYVVYKLFFKSSDKVYIGKTYNINKRITDHLYSVNVLKEKSFKGSWMRKHLKLSRLEYDILYETEDERDCYLKELEFIKEFAQAGVKLVNCQRLIEAGGVRGTARVLSEDDKTKRTKMFGKQHVLIDKEGNVYNTDCLKKWAEDRGLEYKNLHSCVRGKTNSSQGYKVFYGGDWASKGDEEKLGIINEFKRYDKSKTSKQLSKADSLKKEFWILNKNGDIEYGFGITEYCKIMEYNDGNIINTHRYRRPMYGKILFYSLEDLEVFRSTEYYKFYNVLDESDVRNIIEKVSITKKFSKERRKVIKDLATKYHCSERRISDTFNKNFNKH